MCATMTPPFNVPHFDVGSTAPERTLDRGFTVCVNIHGILCCQFTRWERDQYISKSASPSYHMGTADTASEKECRNGDKWL